ncbi:MAG: RHS repeat protein, partial [Exilibacterium sp.]
MKKSFAWKILSIGLLLCGFGPIWVQQAVAQRDGPPAEVVYEIDWNERLKPNLGMQAHDHSLLGDAIDLQTGRLSFEQVDVSIPGNSDLPVEVRRRRNPSQSYGNEFADWQLVAPTISTKIMSTEILNGARWGKRRCSKPLKRAIPDSLFAQKEFNEIPGILLPQQYSDGVLLDVPGRASTQVLDKTVTGSWPADAQKVTAAGWYLTCIANIDGKGTEGFHAYAPNGDRYRFDVVRLRKGVSGQERWKIEPTRRGNYDVTGFGIEGTYYDVLAASQVVDVNNNWVRYDYDDQGRLTSIRANDGRRINFAYRSSTSIVVATATANPGSSDERRWTYSYGTESVYSYTTSSANGRATYEYSNVGGYAKRNLALTRVMLPDGRQWRFNLGGLFAGAVSGDSYRPRGSSEVVTCKQADQVVSVTHPDGMTGEFKLSERTVYMPISASGLGSPCPHASLGRRNSDAHTDMMSVVKKTLFGPGVPTATWKYSYETGGPERTTIIQPDGSKIYNIYPVISTAAPSAITSSALYANEFDATPLQLTEYTYLLEPAAGKGFFPSKPENTKPLRQKEVTLTRGSDWYKTRYSYISDRNASNYSYGFPTKIEKLSSLGGGRRTTDITYVKDENDWILGLTNTVTRNGKLFDDYDYDPAGRLVTHKRFGVTIARLGYVTSGRASGRIAWHKDALGRKTTYSSNWDRGVPVKIEYADNSSFERKVDRNGWVIRETNARGYITNYEYDDAGRLTKIDLPDDLNDWMDTDIDYTYSDGMLLQTATESYFKKTTTTYDAMLRPVRVEREDLRGERVAPGDYVETTYDAMGRVIFTSLPTYVDETNIYAPYGTITRYDALGRVKHRISSDRGR